MNDKLNQYLIEEYPHNIIISHESLILGTGGGIKKVQKQDLLVMNTDNLWQLSFISEIEKAIAHFSQNQHIENLLLVNSDSSNNDLEINDKNIIFPSYKKYKISRLPSFTQ